jgi:hypothetical protein
LRPAYFKTLYCVALLLLYLGLSALSFRGYELQSVMVVLIVPVYWVVLFVTIRVVPVDLETTADVHGVLHGINDVSQI